MQNLRLNTVRFKIFYVALFVFATWAVAYAQELPEGDVPDLFKLIFSEAMLAQIIAVIGTTKLVRSLLGGIKGTAALVITIVVGLGAGYVQFNGEIGWMLSLVVGLAGGLASAGAFKAVKLTGGKGGNNGLSGLLSKVGFLAKLLQK